jgi:hypothetical protein
LPHPNLHHYHYHLSETAGAAFSLLWRRLPWRYRFFLWLCFNNSCFFILLHFCFTAQFTFMCT